MNQKEFVSLDEKRALDQLYDYYESGLKHHFHSILEVLLMVQM